VQLVICDDNKAVIKELEKKLKTRYADALSIHSFSTVFSALTYVHDIAKGDVDMAILDINIEDGNGIELARKLQKLYPHIKVIFLTGYLHYAADIFQATPVYFLVKPIQDERLFEAMDRAIVSVDKLRHDMLQVSIKGKICRVLMEDIRYIESEKRTLHIYEKNGKISVLKQINAIEPELPEQFLRCHQSYCVNMNWIKEFASDIFLYSGERIPVSRKRYKEAKQKFLRFIGDQI